MKGLKSNFNLLNNETNLFLLLLYGLIPVSFKYIFNNLYISLILFSLILLNEIISKIKPVKNIKQIRVLLLLIFLYSFFINSKLLGLIIITNFILLPVSTLIGEKYPHYQRINKYIINITQMFAFFFLFFILSLIYIYYLSNYILKSELLYLFLNSLILSIFTEIKIWELSRETSFLLISTTFLLLSYYVDLRIHISSINIVFGSIISLFAWFILIIFDIIKLKKSFKYYLILFLFYIGLGYMLFLYNFLILILYAIVIKSKSTNKYFITIDDIKYIFLLSLIIDFLLFLIPHRLFIKTALFISTSSLFLYKNINFFKYYLKFIKKEWHIYVFLILFSLILSFIGFKLNLFYAKNFLPVILLINLTWIIYYLLNKRNLLWSDNTSDFILSFIPFHIYLIWSLR